VAEHVDPIMADFVTPTSAEPVPTVEPSFASAAVSEEPTYSPQPELEDAVDPDDPFESEEQPDEPGEAFSSPNDSGTAQDQDGTPTAEAHDAAPADDPAAAGHDDNEGGSSSEPSP
jgi:hypothetical protein